MFDLWQRGVRSEEEISVRRGRQTAWSRECKWYCPFLPLLREGKAAGASAGTAQLPAQEGDLDYAQHPQRDPRRQLQLLLSAARWMGLCLKEASRDKERSFSALKCGEHQPAACGEGR